MDPGKKKKMSPIYHVVLKSVIISSYKFKYSDGGTPVIAIHAVGFFNRQEIQSNVQKSISTCMLSDCLVYSQALTQ